MILVLLAIAFVAASGESRSEAWNSFSGFVMLASLALAFVIGILNIL